MNISIRDLPPVGGVLVVLFFFLPWVTISCGMAPGMRIDASGYEMASGNYDELGTLSDLSSSLGGSDVGGADSMPLFWLIPLFGLGAFGTLLRSREGMLAAFVAGCLGIVGLVVFAIGISTYSDDLARGGFDMSLRSGYWLSWLAFLIQAGTSGRALREEGSVGFGVPGVQISIGGESERSPPIAEEIPSRPPPSGRPMARLKIVRGPLAGREIAITTDDYLIGRGSMCDLQLRDPTVSRRHARLRYGQGSWFIQDQGSSGGIFINGRKVSAGRLNFGDQVEIGNTTFEFRL